MELLLSLANLLYMMLGALAAIFGIVCWDFFVLAKRGYTSVRNVRVLSCPLRTREHLTAFLDVLQDAIPMVYDALSEVTPVLHRKRNKIAKMLSCFDLRVYEPDGVIRTSARPSGINFGVNPPARIATAVESKPWSWRHPRGKYVIHVLALRDRVPRSAIIHALVEHVWPLMLEGHSNVTLDPRWTVLRETLSGQVDVITEIRADVTGVGVVCSRCPVGIDP